MAPARIDEDTGSTTGGESWANSGSCRPSFANTEDKLEPIAVIGFSIKFPQEAVSPESFWDMLTEARSAMTDFPKDRFNLNSFYHPDANRHDTINIRGGHFIQEDLGAFDAPFFSITSAEAASMDPQQRILLETAYRALENAGVPMEKAAGSKTSVHIGNFTREYALLLSRDPELATKYTATSLESSMLANRLSWFYDLVGPSVCLDTACSSSLMALHIACQGLRSRESTMGLVGGCNIFFNPESSAALGNLNFLSVDSRCHSFDHRANGYSRGEGFGVLVIKLLADAIRDGDTIRAIIRATGSNHDGKTPSATQPSRAAQEALIRNTYRDGGLDLKTTRYFEAHGTGTAVGDPIEASAIGAAFRNQRDRSEPLYIGAVKTNIGHLEATSGIAGIVKAIMVLERGVIPPNFGYEYANPRISTSAWNIEFPTQNTPWPTSGLRRASVNSFGFGGSNVHVVLDDAFNYLKLRGLKGNHCTLQISSAIQQPAINLDDSYQTCSSYLTQRSPPKLIVFSASDEAGVSRLANSYSKYLLALSPTNPDPTYIENLAYTMGIKRSSLPWKSFIVAESVQQLGETLLNSLSTPIRSSNKKPKIGFIFTGQGAQTNTMGRELMLYSVFEASLQAADLYFKEEFACPWSLLEECNKDKENSKINSPNFSQPICTALQIALVDLLRSWGISASAVVGHSSGEIAAAYCAGGLSRKSAWRVAYYRGALAARLIERDQAAMTMMAVGLSADEAQAYIDEIMSQFSIPGVTIGCINSPKNVTVTGSEVQIDALRSRLIEKSIFAQKLRINVAYHSSYMIEVAAEYRSLLKGIQASDQATGFFPSMVSSVTGSIISIEELTQPEYWIKNMISPVLFSDAIHRMCWQSPKTLRKKLGAGKSTVTVDDLVEIGPHSALQAPIKDVLKILVKREDITYSSMLARNSSALSSALEVVGRLYCLGYHVNFFEVNQTATKDRPMILPDLPEYPFNHSQTYWLESRLSKNFRFREHARNLFLGSTAPERNSLVARWRNIIRASENPWIGDHQINGAYIYPAAGMLVMAIEAAQQISDNGRRITGYKLRNVTFSKALNINLKPEGVETQFYMRRLANSNDKSTDWNEFRLCSFDNGEWFDNCQGNILAEYELASSEVDAAKEQEEQNRCAREVFQACVRDCGRNIDPHQMYSHMQDWGYGFGSTFKILGIMSHDNRGKATATINLTESLFEGNQKDLPSVIHPASLDGIMQLVFPAFSRGGTKQILTSVPTRIEKLWIANSRFYPPDKSSIVGYAHTVSKGLREISSKVYAFDEVGERLCVSIEGYEATAVAGRSTSQLSQPKMRRLCYSIDWKPDIDTFDKEQLLAYCEAARPVHASPIGFFQDLEYLCFLSISKTLEGLSLKTSLDLRPYLQKYVEWMRYRSSDYLAGKLSTQPLWRDKSMNLESQDELLKRVRDTNIEGSFYAEVTMNIQSILYGEVDALEFFLQGDLTSDFYRDAEGPKNCFKVLGAYLDALAHKNPGMRILEIGAGTGGLTKQILETLVLNQGQEPRVGRYAIYDFTDISPSFFEKAKERFYSLHDGMRFATLDIEEDPIQQGFHEGTYDLIIAGNVLHATKYLNATLRNTRKLLKTGGRLILFEVTNPKILRTGLAFGLLPGWWASTENNRQSGPCMEEQDWHEMLSRNGFSGTDLIFRDYHDDRCHETSIMVSSASEIFHDLSNMLPAQIPHGSPSLPKTVIVISNDPYARQIAIAHGLKARLEQIGIPGCEILTIQELHSKHILDQAFCIFLPETQAPFLRDINAENFSILKMVIKESKGLLWATKGGGVSAITPDVDLVKGLSRTVCSENGRFLFVTVALEDSESRALQNVTNIIKVFMRTALALKERENCDTEYEERDGILFINRVIEDHMQNHDISLRLLPQKSKIQRFEGGPPLTLTISSPGLLNTLMYVNDASFMHPLGSDEIEVEVKASGTSFMDILVALGRVSSETLGAECAGIVRQAGREAGFQPGDRVCAIALGTYKSYVRCKGLCAVKVPDNIPLHDSAALPIVSTTAYHALYMVARMTHKDSILIHCGAGGTGQAAIQISKLIGAEIFTTVGSEEKKKLIINLYGIPEDHIFYSRDLSFSQGVKRMTRDRGVDVILNSLAGEGLIASWECIAPFGRFIEIGKKDIFAHGSLPMFPFARNVTFSFVDIAGMSQEHPEMLNGLLREVMGLLEKKKLCIPQPLHVYGVSEVEKAFRYLQSGKNTGKVVIEIRKDEMVQTVLDTESLHHFKESATYVIAGGLGGVGRSIARWMTHRGAKNLILLSRSGPKTEAAIMLCKELKDDGVHVEAPACDVTNADSLMSVLSHCAQSMPPIKGCIQASMVLKDSIFEKMSLENFKAALDPKVAGSWNLHTHLPKSMDFFILLSSVTGVIGSRGQSNYTCGNTYQDALARHRIALGEKAVAIDLGSILGVGVVAENKLIKDAIDAAGFFREITEAELHAVLDRYCDPALELLSPQTCQVVMGLETPASLKARNIEEAYWMTKPLFRHFYQMNGSDKLCSTRPSQTVVNLASLLGSATRLSDASAIVTESLVKKLSKSLSTPEADIDTSKPLHFYGVDSLVALELRSWFDKEMNADIAIFDIMGSGSIAAVSDFVASKSLYWTEK